MSVEMAALHEEEILDEPEFKWNRKRGVGRKNKDVHFYESFSYDGVDYMLYDSVYMYCEGITEPYIGKLVRIWESPDKSKKIKVQWFFRPSEIAYYIRNVDVLENELFLASGAGNGLVNINPLEAIAGKCNVVCISTDSRNPQPSEEELKKADYVFYRFFDVGSCKISDQIGDLVGGLEVKYVFKRESVGSPNVPKVDLSRKDAAISAIASKDTIKLSDSARKTGVTNGILKSAMVGASSSGEKLKISLRGAKDEKLSEEASVFEDKLSKETPSSGHVNYSLGLERDSKYLRETLPQTNTILCGEKLEFVQLTNSSEVKDFEGFGQANKQMKTSSATMKGQWKSKDEASKEKLKRGHDACDVATSKLLSSDSSPHEGMTKKAKLDDSMKVTGNYKYENMSKKLMEKTCSLQTKNLSPHVTSFEGKSNIGKGTLKENHNEKMAKLSKDSLPIQEDENVGGGNIEVHRRPNVEKSNWMKLPWEERMKDAHDKGKLVFLQNLDPGYTSGEVEDIIWFAFKEHCTAKVVQHIAISNPHSGQAFVIFKAKDAVEKVMRKLNHGCLMLSNQRPLVASTGYFPKLEKQMTFVGHLSIDKARRQAQREMKDSVSTSHYSQHNTIEYEMAIEWCLLQSKSDEWWGKLYEQQSKELKKLKDDLKQQSR